VVVGCEATDREKVLDDIRGNKDGVEVEWSQKNQSPTKVTETVEPFPKMIDNGWKGWGM
jgi:hypothetical protein